MRDCSPNMCRVELIQLRAFGRLGKEPEALSCRIRSAQECRTTTSKCSHRSQVSNLGTGCTCCSQNLLLAVDAHIHHCMPMYGPASLHHTARTGISNSRGNLKQLTSHCFHCRSLVKDMIALVKTSMALGTRCTIAQLMLMGMCLMVMIVWSPMRSCKN